MDKGGGESNFITLDNVEISEKNLLQAINSLKINKKEGVDGLNSTIFVESKNGLCLPLLKLFKASMELGKVPNDWKLANVSPIFKKGSKRDPGNYRPVSLTCQACKILEKILKEEIINFLEENKRLSNSQHGFRSKRSCLTNLLEFTEQVLEHMDNRESVDVLYFDLQKAFDKVPHRSLLHKLHKIGIRGNILKWIEDWLSGRKQRVVLNGEKSSWIDVTSGVPQGSVLGPILFIIYINDIDENIVNKFWKFADDSKMIGKVGSEQNIATVKNDLQELIDWSDRW